MIRFLADENFPLPSVQHLRRKGHDVEAVAETSPGIADTDVLVWADREQRVLLTFDGDFGNLLYHQHTQYKLLAGVMYLRFVPTSPTHAAERVLEVLNTHGPIQSSYVTVERTTVRHRPLP